MINLQQCNDQIFLWNASDISKLRKEYRIVGSFIGSLPKYSRQNNDLGLPLLLTNEETKLLIDKGIATIVKYHFSTNNDSKQLYEKIRKEFYRENCERIKAKRKENLFKFTDKIIAGKMSSDANELNRNREELKEQIIQQEIDNISNISCDLSNFAILYKSCPLDNRESSSISLNYPNTKEEMIRYFVFSDLWHKNYYLTNGFKFGCDYLAYENDPIVYHSKYMIFCKVSQQPLTEQQIQNYGRLAKSVRKTVLIAIYHDIILSNDCVSNKPQIEYFTIKWQNY